MFLTEVTRTQQESNDRLKRQWAENHGLVVDKIHTDGAMDVSPKEKGIAFFVDSIFPFRLNILNGSLTIHSNYISSLFNTPRTIISGFRLTGTTQISSLDGMPTTVMGTFSMFNTGVTNLHNIHKHLKRCSKIIVTEEIKSHVLGLLLIKDLHTLLVDAIANQHAPIFRVEQIINRHLKAGRDIHECQEELLDAGLSQYAKL